MDETAIFQTLLPGDRPLAVDPFRARRLLAASLQGESLRELLHSARGPVPALALPAMEKLVAASRAAFLLPEVDPETGEGFTEAVPLRVLHEFLRWEQGVKKNTGNSPTS